MTTKQRNAAKENARNNARDAIETGIEIPLEAQLAIARLLTRPDANPKLVKGEKLGWQSVGLHLAPAFLSGRNVCPHASPGCTLACLNTAGHGGMIEKETGRNRVQESRIAKTKLFHANPSAFVGRLMKEIANAEKLATKKGFRLCVRLNLTSDIAWEKIRFNGETIFERFPHIQCYDYTKSVRRMIASLVGGKEWPSNYHLTFSRSEVNDEAVSAVLDAGGNVAVVFSGDLPATWNGRPVISGDESDLRFLDARGSIVGLSTKGSAKQDESGFVVSPEAISLMVATGAVIPSEPEANHLNVI